MTQMELEMEPLSLALNVAVVVVLRTTAPVLPQRTKALKWARAEAGQGAGAAATVVEMVVVGQAVTATSASPTPKHRECSEWRVAPKPPSHALSNANHIKYVNATSTHS